MQTDLPLPPLPVDHVPPALVLGGGADTLVPASDVEVSPPLPFCTLLYIATLEMHSNGGALHLLLVILMPCPAPGVCGVALLLVSCRVWWRAVLEHHAPQTCLRMWYISNTRALR